MGICSRNAKLCIRLMFEKYDGIRAVWHPTERVFYSRKGNVLTLPHLVTDSMPSIWLDGEIWYALLSAGQLISFSN